MKIAELKILIASAWLFMTASTQALQPEVFYAFQRSPQNRSVSLVLGSDGHVYGRTWGGGSNDFGTVFNVTTNRILTSLISFNLENGAYPNELVLGPDGNFYGTTFEGGSNNSGTVFKVTTNGVLTTLTSLTGTNGAYPSAGLVLGRDGHFYGTTTDRQDGSENLGTVFQVTTGGVFTSLGSFNHFSRSRPSRLVLGNDGNFYGTTAGNRRFGHYGTVFKVTTKGVLTPLGAFTGTNGKYPEAEGGLVLGHDGNFYGTTAYGGSGEGDGHGTVFQVTTNGELSTLVSFNGTNGANPQAGLVLGRDGNLYGTTANGGNSGYGTVFQVTMNGMLTSLVSFNGTNGASPRAGLVLGHDGNLYGTTAEVGPGGGGTIFRLVISEFTSVVRQPNGSVLLTGTGPGDGAYRLWASADLSLPLASWTLLTSASFDSSGHFSYTDAGAATNSSRFYQLSVP